MNIKIRTSENLDELITNVILIGDQGEHLVIETEKEIYHFNKLHWIFSRMVKEENV